MKEKLPDFLIVGAAKSGTTSLHKYLSEHNEICMPKIKETFFFTGKNFNNINVKGNNYGKAAITQLKKYLDSFSTCKEKKIWGEACVAYLYFYKNTIKNIKKYNLEENIKIIIILRNPIDRAFSNYLHHVRDGYETLSFEKAIENINNRMNNNWWWGYDYLGAGLYYNQVKAYLENFDNVKIYLYDDLQKDRLGLVQDIYRFLEVNDNFVPESLNEKYNVSGIPKNKFLHKFLREENLIKDIIKPVVKTVLPDKVRHKLINKIMQKNLQKPQMKPETREYLKNYYKQDILKLQDLINRDLTHWLKD